MEMKDEQHAVLKTPAGRAAMGYVHDKGDEEEEGGVMKVRGASMPSKRGAQQCNPFLPRNLRTA